MAGVLFLLMLLCSCAGLKYSQSSDQADARIISQAQTLTAQSTEPYSTHSAAVDALKASIDSLKTVEAGRSHNQTTVAMWTAVQTDKGNLYDFFNLWRQQGQLSPAMAEQSSKQMAILLAPIRDLEQKKKGGPLNK